MHCKAQETERRRELYAAIKAELRRRGLTVTSWAATNGYTLNQVRDVLRGRADGQFGRSHEIAVKLGLKAGVIGATFDGILPPRSS